MAVAVQAIRGAADGPAAKAALVSRFALSEAQAEGVLAMTLRSVDLVACKKVASSTAVNLCVVPSGSMEMGLLLPRMAKQPGSIPATVSSQARLTESAVGVVRLLLPAGG